MVPDRSEKEKGKMNFCLTRAITKLKDWENKEGNIQGTSHEPKELATSTWGLTAPILFRDLNGPDLVNSQVTDPCKAGLSMARNVHSQP